MQSFSNREFFKWKQDAAPLTLVATLEGAMRMNEVVGGNNSWPDTTVQFTADQNDGGRLKGQWICALDELVDVGRACFQFVTEDIAQFDARLSNSGQEVRQTFDAIRTLPDACEPEPLKEAYERFMATYVAWWQVNYVMEPLEAYVEDAAASVFGDADWMKILSVNPTRTIVDDERSGLNDICARFLEDEAIQSELFSGDFSKVVKAATESESVSRQIARFQDQMHWCRNTYYRSTQLSFDKVCRIAWDHLHSGTTRSDITSGTDSIAGQLREYFIQHAKDNQESAKCDMPAPDRFVAVLDALPQWKDDRKRLNMEANGIIDQLLHRLCRSRRLMMADARNLFHWEVPTVIDGLAVSAMQDRRTYVGVLWKRGDKRPSVIDAVHREAISLGSRETGTARAMSTDKIYGQGNSLGAVEGIACCAVSVRDAEEQLAKLNGDAILVTHTTTPDWLSVLAKVKGIVTIEGGHGSHAYLAGSQMNIPVLIQVREAESLVSGVRVRLDSGTGCLEILG